MDNTQIPSFKIPKSAETTPVFEGGAEADPSLSTEGTKEILPAPVMPLGQQDAPGATSTHLLPQPLGTNSSTAAPIVDNTHIIADDVDVIEKEWVERAKKIIDLTSDDPYVEAKEISKLKATYLKKRFNKDLPLVDDGVR